MSRRIAFFNRKGGVGKTSLSFHLAGAWAAQGLRVLVLDLDPQASLTQAFLGPKEGWQVPHERTLAALFDDDQNPEPRALIAATSVAGVSLAPAGARLGDFNFPRPQETGPLQEVVRLFVGEVENNYDLLLLDLPPCLQLCSWSALLAATAVVVPVIPEDPGAQGLAHVQRIIDQAIAGPNRDLRLLAYVLNQVNLRLGLHKSYERLLRQLDGDLVAQTVLPIATDFKEGIANRKPLSAWKPRGAPAKRIAALAEELDAQYESLAARPARFYDLANRFETADGSERIPA